MAITPFTANNAAYPTYHLMPDPVFSPFPNMFQGGSPETFLGSKKITPLKQVLERVALGQFKHSFVKEKGYFSRFFSSESWSEWVEDRTPLGTVISLFKEWCERPSNELIRRMKPFLAQAKREASCALSIAGGALGSAATHNPLPLVWGLSDCLNSAEAIPVVNNTIPNYTIDWFTVNYQFANDTFYDTDGEALFYSASQVNGQALPAELKFDSPTRTFSGSLSRRSSIRVFAKNSQSEEAYTDFDMKLDTSAIILTVAIFGGLSITLCVLCYFTCCNRQRTSINDTPVSNYGAATSYSLDPSPSTALLINDADEEELIATLPSNVNAICVICSQIMTDPVILPDLKRIDRRCIQQYYDEGGRFCPETRAPLPDPKMLPTDTQLKKIIEDFKKSKQCKK